MKAKPKDSKILYMLPIRVHHTRAPLGLSSLLARLIIVVIALTARCANNAERGSAYRTVKLPSRGLHRLGFLLVHYTRTPLGLRSLLTRRRIIVEALGT